VHNEDINRTQTRDEGDQTNLTASVMRYFLEFALNRELNGPKEGLEEVVIAGQITLSNVFPRNPVCKCFEITDMSDISSHENLLLRFREFLIRRVSNKDVDHPCYVVGL